MRKLAILLVVLLAVAAHAAPWLDLFWNSVPQQGDGWWSSSSNTGYRRAKLGGKERYKQLCRVLNPDNYAFPDKIPYPSAPLCPY